jgi:hypothetical protein
MPKENFVICIDYDAHWTVRGMPEINFVKFFVKTIDKPK